MPTSKFVSECRAFRFVLVAVACLLFTVRSPRLTANDCTCGREYHRQQQCHHCCPPGLLDRLNDLSDAAEYRWQRLMNRIDQFGGQRSCDDCAGSCDACDHPLSAWINRSMQAENHPHRNPSQTHQHAKNGTSRQTDRAPFTQSQEPPVPKNLSKPVRALPDSNHLRDGGRLPDWLKNPFKDEARSERSQRVRAASSHSITKPSTLHFDPRAEDNSKKTLEQLLEEIMLQGTIADTERWRRRVALGENSLHPTVRHHLTDGAIEGASNKTSTTSEVIRASAFAPVLVAPVPNLK